MTTTATKTIAGLHCTCLHCHRTITTGNLPIATLRGNHLHGYTHIACSDPYLMIANLNSSLYTYSTEGI